MIKQTVKQQIAAIEGFSIKALQFLKKKKYEEAKKQLSLFNRQTRKFYWRKSGLRSLPKDEKSKELKKKVKNLRVEAKIALKKIGVLNYKKAIQILGVVVQEVEEVREILKNEVNLGFELPEFLEPLDMNFELPYLGGSYEPELDFYGLTLLIMHKKIKKYKKQKIKDLLEKLDELEKKHKLREISQYGFAQIALIILNGHELTEEEVGAIKKTDKKTFDHIPLFLTLADIFGIYKRIKINPKALVLSDNYQWCFSSKNDMERLDVCLSGFYFNEIFSKSWLSSKVNLFINKLRTQIIPLIKGERIISLSTMSHYYRGEEERNMVSLSHPSHYTIYWLLKYACKDVGKKYAHLIMPLLDKNSTKLIEEFNKQDCNIFKNLTVAEIGGNHSNDYLSALFGEYKDQSGGDYQKVGERRDVNLKSYKNFFKHKYAFSMSTRLFDRGSTGKSDHEEDKSFVELFCVFANITKKKGYSIHFGEPIPGVVENKKLWKFAGFKMIDHFSDYLYVFEKVDNREITPEVFEEEYNKGTFRPKRYF